jgi:hypothetical protein
MKRLVRLMTATALLLGCNRQPGDPTRERLADAIRDSLGQMSNPQVGVLRDRRHLLLNLDTAAFAGLSESGFSARAESVVRFATRHYRDVRHVDSITVVSRYPLQPGVWKIVHEQTWATKDLATTAR